MTLVSGNIRFMQIFAGVLWRGDQTTVGLSKTLLAVVAIIHTLFQNTCVFGAYHENLNEDRSTYSQWRRCSPMTSFWQYKVYADIRMGSLERGSYDSRVVEIVDFQSFRTPHLRK